MLQPCCFAAMPVLMQARRDADPELAALRQAVACLDRVQLLWPSLPRARQAALHQVLGEIEERVAQLLEADDPYRAPADEPCGAPADEPDDWQRL